MARAGPLDSRRAFEDNPRLRTRASILVRPQGLLGGAMVRSLLWTIGAFAVLSTPALAGASPEQGDGVAWATSGASTREAGTRQQASAPRPVTASSRSTQFADPAGDVPAGGMDITNVVVSADSGRLTFAIEIPTHPTLPATKHIAVGLDTDRNVATGRGGLDYRLWVTGSRNSVELDRWSGSSWVFVHDRSVTHTYQRGVTIGISTLSLGTASFDFVVATFGQDAVTLEDGAPDEGMWRFDLELTCFGSAPTGIPTEGPDVLIGTAADDAINGLGGDDKICAGAGSDSIFGGAGNDQVDAGPDLDGVVGGLGDDQLEGGDGVDLLFYLDSLTGVRVNLATGVATGVGTDRLSGFEAVAGSLFDDMLEGGAAGEFFFPFAGDDVIRGGAGFDFVVFLRVSVNASLATGRATGEGRDQLSGIEGLAACPAVLLADPALGISNCGSASATPAVLVGDGEDNFLLGGDQRDVLAGGGGDDTQRGLAGNDLIRGGAGADLIEGGAGLDVMDGGPGVRDVVTYLSSPTPIRLDLASRTARGQGTDRLNGFEAVVGSERADVLAGAAGRDTLQGMGGTDRLDGRTGDDFLDGGEGSDRLAGGAGRDFCVDGERTSGCEARDRTRGTTKLRAPSSARTVTRVDSLNTAFGLPLAFLSSVVAAAADSISVTNRPVGCDSTRRRTVTWVDPPRQVVPIAGLPGEQTAEWQARLTLRRERVFATAEVEAVIKGDVLRNDGWPTLWVDDRDRPYRAVHRPLRGSGPHVWKAEVRIIGGPTSEQILGACP
jgi:Ca2+-binding RTX toxin-like protein